MTAEAILRTTRDDLATRVDNGVTVTLFWYRATDVASVTVEDPANAVHFELVVAENESPLDVFHHPFAYAAARGLDLSTPREHQAPVFIDV